MQAKLNWNYKHSSPPRTPPLQSEHVISSANLEISTVAFIAIKHSIRPVLRSRPGRLLTKDRRNVSAPGPSVGDYIVGHVSGPDLNKNAAIMSGLAQTSQLKRTRVGVAPAAASASIVWPPPGPRSQRPRCPG